MMNRTPSAAASLVKILATNVRGLRAQRGLSLNELAAKAHVAKATLSQLEAGRGNPSIETLWSIAGALDVPFGQLIDERAEGMRVVRAGEGLKIEERDTGVSVRLLSTRTGRGGYEIYIMELGAGASRKAAPHAPGTTEHVYVLDGRVRVGPGKEPLELGKGDFASFDASEAHLYGAIRGTVGLFVVLEYR